MARNHSKLEGVCREPTIDDTSQRSGTEPLSKRGGWYGVKMQQLRDSVGSLRKDLRDKERDNLRLKNKYTFSKKRLLQLQEELAKHTERELNFDSELEFLRLQLLEKDNELSKHVERKHGYQLENGGSFGGKSETEENCRIKDAEESCIVDNSFLSSMFLNIRKETRKLLTFILLCCAVCCSLVTIIVGSSVLPSILVGFWTSGLSCLWLERKQLFKSFMIEYLKKLREVSVKNSLLRIEASKLESRLTEVDQELTNKKQEYNDVILKLKTMGDKLGEEKAKNEELVKLEKSTFEDLQSERVRRRRAEEQLEEVSVQIMTAREKNEDAQGGDVCVELRNNLKLERESKEKLSKENERLIKEIVEMNMKQEKEQLKREESVDRAVQTKNEEKEKIFQERAELVDGKSDESDLKHSNNRIEDGEKRLPRAAQEMIEKPSNFDQEIKGIDSRGCRKTENLASATSNSHETSLGIAHQDVNDGVSNNCWLCASNTPNETSLAFFIIVACLVLALKYPGDFPDEDRYDLKNNDDYSDSDQMPSVRVSKDELLVQ